MSPNDLDSFAVSAVYSTTLLLKMKKKTVWIDSVFFLFVAFVIVLNFLRKSVEHTAFWIVMCVFFSPRESNEKWSIKWIECFFSRFRDFFHT